MIETVSINGEIWFAVMIEIEDEIFTWVWSAENKWETRYQIAKLAASHKTVFNWWDAIEVYKLMGQAMKETK